jgi:hypothetical protein
MYPYYLITRSINRRRCSVTVTSQKDATEKLHRTGASSSRSAGRLPKQLLGVIKTIQKKNRFNSCGGYSLAELMVAAGIIGLIVIAVSASLRTGVQIETSDLHRRQARVIIDSCFESSDYQYSNFSNLPEVSGEEVLIDPRDIGSQDDLTGVLNIQVDSLEMTAWDGTEIPYKTVEIRVSWDEAGRRDSLILTKWFTQL